MDFFVSIYNMQRDEKYWPNANTYDPTRWKGQLYPNEIASDYAFVPFGGGIRKCPGDIFSMLETTVILAMILREFNFDLQVPAESLEPVSAATLNTANGVPM